MVCKIHYFCSMKKIFVVTMAALLAAVGTVCPQSLKAQEADQPLQRSRVVTNGLLDNWFLQGGLQWNENGVWKPFQGKLALGKWWSPTIGTRIALTGWQGNHYAIDWSRVPMDDYVITEKDVAKGYVVRPLHEGYRPDAPMLLPDSVRPYSYYRRDTLTRFTFDAPDSTWLSISVTDDHLTPVDTAASITHMLPLVPDLFSLETISSDTSLYKPRFFYERSQSISGRLTYRLYNKPYKVVLVNVTNSEIYTTECEDDGVFHFRNLSYPDSTLFCIMAFAPNGKPTKAIEIDNFSLPKTIQHLPSDAKQYYLKLTSDTIAADTTAKSAKAEPDKNKEKLEQKVKEMLVSSEPDDIYTRSAHKTKYTRTLSDYKYYELKDMILKFDDITFDGEVAKYKTNGMHVPVRFVVGTTEMPIEKDSLGKYLPQKALEIPVEMVYAVDFIHPEVARTIGRTEYPESPIIRIDLKKLNELVYESGWNDVLKLVMPLGYVKRLQFPNIHVSRSPRATRFWNPEYFTGPSGRVTLDLPLPTDYHTTYTLRAEGITPHGEPVSLIYRIQK